MVINYCLFNSTDEYMSKILRKTSNPKKPEEYLKMFDKLKLLILAYHDSLGESSNYSNMIDDIRLGMWFEPTINNALYFQKNERIESYLKFIRAVMCQNWLNEFIKGQSARKELTPEGEKLKTYCQKEVEVYLSKSEKTEAETRSKDTLRISNVLSGLNHFIDLYNSDKNTYRAIGEYSWANKTPSKIIFDLSEIEDELKSTRKVSKVEYERKIAEAENTEEYLKVDSKYTWYIIESYSCSFEAYLNQHCGTDSSADVLFSLRSKDKEGYFDSHVTISASIKTIDKAIFGTPAVFVVKQVKGKGNNKPNERYWPYIVKLFLEKEFGWQQVGSYKPENDFHIEDLDELSERKFLKEKPWWNKPFLALKHYGLMKDSKAFTAKYWGAKSAEFDDEGTLRITYHSFGEMIEQLDKHWGFSQRGRNRNSENLISQAKYYVDDFHPDIDYRKSDIWVDDFFLWIKNKKKKTYNKIVDCMEKEGLSEIKEIFDLDYASFSSEDVCKTFLHGVAEAMETAYRDGLEVGERDAAYRAFEDYFDEYRINYDGRVDMGQFYKNSDGTWTLRIYQEALSEYYEESGEFGVPDPDSDSLEMPKRGIEWSGDFDEEIAAERLFEMLPD